MCTILSWLPQEEYAREGIDWSYVEFIDNQECLDVLEGSQESPSLAVFPLIDEACRLPRATYQVHSLQILMLDEYLGCHDSMPNNQFTMPKNVFRSSTAYCFIIKLQLCASEASVCTADNLAQGWYSF